ncbi:nucleoside diphosphate kinase 7 isoform X2 [Selaginella moellendorffii]|uniref:nucleoside diphosphate kinase 7 isoform X2 n=1 Tax=Selaginella moellendorffii TaxID=88036 RepID=UPI000D1CC803|nr:nucleoside diphosphate kinase 7 isoform X2 [Selaginella moellendorffii]|eukprot:XP_024525284.1 nucleoside diphosphate kinase 7 isoform X2 [Selaginella moellendorffii]
MAEGARYCFIVRWLDPTSALIWKYQFFYNTADSSIEMYDIKNQKIFLKRVSHPEIRLEHLYIGGTFVLYSRQLVVEDYGDDFTRKELSNLQETTIAVIKPDAIDNVGKIIDIIYSNGFLVKQMRMCKLSSQQAAQFYKAHAGKHFFGHITSHMSSGPCVALELVAEDAISKWRLLLGPTDSVEAKVKAPSSIRAEFGSDETRNACHGSDSPSAAKQESDFFFKDKSLGFCAKLKHCTLCLIKPHAVFDGNRLLSRFTKANLDAGTTGFAGIIIDAILKRFVITAMELVTFGRPSALDFYELYNGVCSDYHAMAQELSVGPFIAMEVCYESGDDNPVNDFRDFCGPPDAAMCKALRPSTLRAQYGINKVKNAIHCTDLPEDGVTECTYVFTHKFNPTQEATVYKNHNLR